MIGCKFGKSATAVKNEYDAQLPTIMSSHNNEINSVENNQNRNENPTASS